MAVMQQIPQLPFTRIPLNSVCIPFAEEFREAYAVGKKLGTLDLKVTGKVGGWVGGVRL